MEDNHFIHMQYCTHISACDSCSGTEVWPQVWPGDSVVWGRGLCQAFHKYTPNQVSMYIFPRQIFSCIVSQAQQEVRYFGFCAFWHEVHLTVHRIYVRFTIYNVKKLLIFNCEEISNISHCVEIAKKISIYMSHHTNRNASYIFQELLQLILYRLLVMMIMMKSS